ncbi:uncharacterized protein RHOBADRAFT_49816 [Rhodotorula graminis WP1]|uniref:Uncharacterized protein n=1 Tax=Rhodotorula graminis (strain WP1) TaxID=578459 RepID=A0A194S2X2_RHOGW|nr:uncharacterized protein RHOBADRAFT_49816 [Rhodotorula graminis WP1]KPV75083.1 hypothetical protein RHOBADRAFT_49816 [Rhodotorula graminis WP1]
MASRALTPWLTREWLSHRNLHGATLPDTPTVETKRLQLVTATGISHDPDDTLLWCEVTDGECWIDCCIPTSLVDAFDSTTSFKFTASSATKCLFRAHSWRFVLASPLVPARSSPSKRHLAATAAGHQQRKSPRVCLRLERFDRHSTGDGNFAESFAFRDAARDDGAKGKGTGEGARAESDKQRAMWVRKVEQAALGWQAGAEKGAPEVAYAADLPPDPARRTRPAPAPAPVRNPPLFPTASTSSSSSSAAPAAPPVALAHEPTRLRPSWPADGTPVRLDWASAKALLDRRAASTTAKSAKAGGVRRNSEAQNVPPAPVQPSASGARARDDAPAPVAGTAPVSLDWTAASSLLSSSARKRTTSASLAPAAAASPSPSTRAPLGSPATAAPSATPVALDWTAAESLLVSSSARKRARTSTGSTSTSSAAVLESNRALLDHEARSRARAQAQGRSPTGSQPQPQTQPQRVLSSAEQDAAHKRKQERLRLLAVQLANVGGGGAAASAALASVRAADASGRVSPRGRGAARGSAGPAAAREARPGEKKDGEAALRAREARRESSGPSSQAERKVERGQREAATARATTTAPAPPSLPVSTRRDSPPPSAPSPPPPPPRQSSPALSIRSQASGPDGAVDEDVVMRDASSPAPPPRPERPQQPSSQPRAIGEQHPLPPHRPSDATAAVLASRFPPPRPPQLPLAPMVALPLVRPASPPYPPPAPADFAPLVAAQPQQQPLSKPAVAPPAAAPSPARAQTAADLDAQPAKHDAVPPASTRTVTSAVKRRRDDEDDGASGRDVAAHQRRCSTAGSSAAPSRRSEPVVDARPLIPLEVWDFAAWLRSRGLEGFAPQVPPEGEGEGEVERGGGELVRRQSRRPVPANRGRSAELLPSVTESKRAVESRSKPRFAPLSAALVPLVPLRLLAMLYRSLRKARRNEEDSDSSSSDEEHERRRRPSQVASLGSQAVQHEGTGMLVVCASF